MTHAPKFWADKLPPALRPQFCALIDQGFSGETAYCRLLVIPQMPVEDPLAWSRRAGVEEF